MVETDVAHRVNNTLRVDAVVAVVVSQSFDAWPLHALRQALPRDRAALSRRYVATPCIATSSAARQSGTLEYSSLLANIAVDFHVCEAMWICSHSREMLHDVGVLPCISASLAAKQSGTLEHSFLLANVAVDLNVSGLVNLLP
eukprot:CAMPEP_0183499594 /NCGR_PEP_ID=MMETSP0371-20130417/1820_1 /TAXON_ID=268820 /ORGANISM="Peridinium aciculiferum, Strain PAER-2" /LENGTH=142 /DNA_ID=CAMNT_0025693455 /DNA_START=69 /DNA_END=493 /DNA_ORIENTATION=+